MSTQDRLFMHTEHRQIYCSSISKCFKSRTSWEILMVLRQNKNGKQVPQPWLYGAVDTAGHILDVIRMKTVNIDSLLSPVPAVIAQSTQMANRISDFSGALLSETHCDPIGLGERTVWSTLSVLASPAGQAIKSFRQSLIVLLQKLPLKKEVRLNKGDEFFSVLLRRLNICLYSQIAL